jgi:hypothetical protein
MVATSYEKLVYANDRRELYGEMMIFPLRRGEVEGE